MTNGRWTGNPKEMRAASGDAAGGRNDERRVRYQLRSGLDWWASAARDDARVPSAARRACRPRNAARGLVSKQHHHTTASNQEPPSLGRDLPGRRRRRRRQHLRRECTA